jgi:transcriptional regulator with GAF, ATPase, and Fis domain
LGKSQEFRALGQNRASSLTRSGTSFKVPIKKNGDNLNEVLTEEELRLREKANIEKALQQTDWKIYGTGGAAELLGLKPTTLLSRIKKMGIEKIG